MPLLRAVPGQGSQASARACIGSIHSLGGCGCDPERSRLSHGRFAGAQRPSPSPFHQSPSLPYHRPAPSAYSTASHRPASPPTLSFRCEVRRGPANSQRGVKKPCPREPLASNTTDSSQNPGACRCATIFPKSQGKASAQRTVEGGGSCRGGQHGVAGEMGRVMGPRSKVIVGRAGR